MKALDLTGQTFGRLTALRVEHKSRHRGWVCRCQCGNEKWVMTGSLTDGHTRSCGCFDRERRVKHGFAIKGKARPRTYQAWADMIQRCQNANLLSYKNYGGDGIQVCPEWRDFATFLRDMGEAPPGTSLDRIDNDADYAPGNCRWATRREQANNRRTNSVLTAFGKTQTIAQWARELNLCEDTLRHRLTRYGWSAERALTEPVRRKTPATNPATQIAKA